MSSVLSNREDEEIHPVNGISELAFQPDSRHELYMTVYNTKKQAFRNHFFRKFKL